MGKVARFYLNSESSASFFFFFPLNKKALHFDLGTDFPHYISVIVFIFVLIHEILMIGDES